MDQASFWLADIGNYSLVVSLVGTGNGLYQTLSLGPLVTYDSTDSFVTAADQSLSTAAADINLPESAEPNRLALIIPPSWVGEDGKIIADKSKLLNRLFQDLKLKPMGFIANDEAIVEEANLADGFPASFVLVNLSQQEITVSLVYLGKVVNRISRPLSAPFDPRILESILIEFNSESALPPQIILTGDISDQILDSVRNFAWIGKKDIETFLHFPEIKSYSLGEVTEIYLRAITSQLQPPPVVEEPEVILPSPEPHAEVAEVLTSDELVEVDAAELGFSSADLPTESDVVVPVSPPSISPPVSPKLPKFSLPKVNLSVPRFQLPSVHFLLIPLVFSPLLILIPFFFSKATITLYLTPYAFNKTLDVTLSSAATEINLSKKIIPVSRQSVEVNSSATIETSGRKTVGDRATGEITVYNKLDKSQSLSKGTVLLDNSGKRYELINSAQIASSSANLDLGVINLGQTRLMVSAYDIGPEYNIGKDVKLRFKDIPETSLVAKVSTGLTGGNKREINAVSAADRANLEQQLTSQMASALETSLAKESNQTSGLIKDAIDIKKSRFEYNREVGEEAAELAGSATGTITLFYLEPSQKSQLLSTLLSDDPNFSGSKFSLDDFTLSIRPKTKSSEEIQGTLTVSGKSIPKINPLNVAKLLAGKTQSQAAVVIQKNLPRVYNYQIATNFAFLKALNPLPFLLQNIKIEVK